MKISLTPEVAYHHIKKYSQYSVTDSWARWYSNVAPLKGQRIVKTFLNYKKKNAKILDLGCGTGMTTLALADNFPNTVACDMGAMEVRATKELLKKYGYRNKVIKYNGKKLPFKDNNFDIVSFIEVIEHVSNPDEVLREIKRVLKPDGILHITTANKLWPIEPHYKLPFLSYLPKNLANKYVQITGKGERYDDIHLPTYWGFKSMVSKCFDVEDITIDILRDYKKYGMDKERGIKVVIIGKFLNKIYDTNHLLYKIISYPLVISSLGWLFIARPKNND